MNLLNGILSRDLGRMARDGAPKLEGRPNTDPRVLAEMEFRDSHNGKSRSVWAETQRAHARQDFEAKTMAAVEGEPPADICSTDGLGPERAALVRFCAWRAAEAQKLSDLEAKRAELQNIIEAPAKTEGAIRGAVKRTADALLGRAADSPASRKSLEDELAENKHRAEAAKQALPRLEREIDAQQIRLSRLNERETEFTRPALLEVADENGLGRFYHKQLTKLKVAYELIVALGSLDSHHMHGMEFPKPALASLKDTQRDDYQIDPDRRVDVWKKLEQALLADPRADTSQFLNLPVM